MLEQPQQEGIYLQVVRERHHHVRSPKEISPRADPSSSGLCSERRSENFDRHCPTESAQCRKCQRNGHFF